MRHVGRPGPTWVSRVEPREELVRYLPTLDVLHPVFSDLIVELGITRPIMLMNTLETTYIVFE